MKCRRIWHHMEAFTLLKETIDAEKLRGLTLDMHALMEDNCTKAVYADSMVRRKHDLFQQCRLPTFLSREWISDFFSKEQVQAGQTKLPEEISRLNSLQLLHLDGCSNLDGLNMELDHHQGRRMLRSDGIFASISYITSLPLKLFVPSMFLARKIPRFTSFSLPHSLTELSLNGTPIRFLPENIKDLSTLRSLVLERCKMLQTLPELPSNLVALDVSFCDSLQGLAKLIPFTRACDCDQLVQFQDLIKQELIQKADMHMFRIMEMVSVQMQPRFFKVLLHPFYCISSLHFSTSPCVSRNICQRRSINVVLMEQIQRRNNLFHVLVYIEGNEMLRFYDEEGEECPNHNEFGEHLSCKVSTPAAHRICGFNIFTWFSSTSELNTLTNPFILEIKNNTKGRSVAFNCFGFLLDLWVEKGWLWISHCNCGVDDLEFDDGDEVTVSVFIDDQRVQIKRIGVRILHEEEGSKNDCNNIQSNNEAITSPSSSSRSSSSDSKEVITAHSRSSFWDNRTLGDGYVAKAAIASQLFRHFFCFTRYNYDLLDLYACFFEKK
ncbi:hypothetical protein DKX38_023603 [Salix brachista]|uniref:Uncharacterized protein n=1 Tax=Salix brachista TaxID=2182728 RepID=A0A5N5JN18_9ROSI|nr:hypothetical protein DKX38_023603 [Salix brachista]